MGSLIVDGYNVIHAWPSLLRRLHEAGLEDARRQLVHELAEYAAYSGDSVTVVFDSHRRQGGVQNEVIDGVSVQYGTSRASADHVIERSAYAAVRSGGAEDVVVVTSDRLQRALVSAMGVATMGAASLREEVARARSEHDRARATMRQAADRSRRVEDNLSEETRHRLERMRRGR